MAGIFISYRRDDSRHAAGRLADDLGAVFGTESIFRDVESIAPGVDFEVALDQALAACAVMLVVIGPRWATITDREGRRRLDQPGDWIRIEVARALERDVRLIPVMLEDTPMPDVAALPSELRGLVRRQSLPLSDGRWKGDLARLVETLERIPGLRRLAPAPTPAPAPPVPAAAGKGHGGLWKGVALGAGGLLVLAYLLAEPSPEVRPLAPGGDAPGPAPDPTPFPVPTPSPAPTPAPAPAPATSLPSSPSPQPVPQVIQVRHGIEGQWVDEGQATTRMRLRLSGERLELEGGATDTRFGTVRGSGRFNGERAELQLQVFVNGQLFASGLCTLMWLPSEQRLQGPCEWPGTQLAPHVVTWRRIGD
jgi:hypothetical protein